MPGNRGVSRGLSQVPGSIGYLSYAFAKQEGLPMAVLENRAGSFIAPSLNSIQVGVSELSLSISESRAFVTDPPGATAYPIVTYSWILCYRVYEDPDKIAMLKEVLSYGLGEGQKSSEELGYVALMDAVAENARGVVDSITLPSSADTATSILIADTESAFAPISGAVSVIDRDAADNTEAPTDALADRKADNFSAKDAAVNQEDDASSSEQPKQGEF